MFVNDVCERCSKMHYQGGFILSLRKLGILVAVLVMSLSAAAFAETLLLEENWAEYEVGHVFDGEGVWYDPDVEAHAEAGTPQTIVEFEGEKVFQIQSHPAANGKLIRDFDFVSGKVYVSIYQPPSGDVTDNIYVDIKNASNQRIFGLFITTSGNVRIRDAGAQSPNVYGLDPGQWHELLIEWDNDAQTYDAYVIYGDFLDPIIEGARFDPGLDGGSTPAQLQFEIARRDVPKIAYYKGVRVLAE